MESRWVYAYLLSRVNVKLIVRVSMSAGLISSVLSHVDNSLDVGSNYALIIAADSMAFQDIIPMMLYK